MINPFGAMYLRPGNLWKNFRIKRLKTVVVSGHPVNNYVDVGRCIDGILAEADANLSERMKHRWDQDQHSLTHTLVVRGKVEINKGDYLTTDERVFLVLLTDDIEALGTTGLLYLEERNDIR